ncbi:PH domain-containing protein [Herbiconiux sp. P15]|uniref:PH domain-containing protein n=1 Tax=Herbiconiux liukaitaii TaxID=3342799 RepID=UPI0035B70BD9
MPHVPEPTVVFRSRFNGVLSVVFWVVCAGALTASVAAGAYGPTAAISIAVVYLAAVVYFVLWRPRLSLDDRAITVHNVLQTVTVPWEALILVDTKFALTLVTPDRRVSVWCAPAPGATGALRASREQGTRARSWTQASEVRPGDLDGTDSGRAAAIVRERWDALRESGSIPLGTAHEARVGVRWSTAAIAVLVLGAVATVAGFALL